MAIRDTKTASDRVFTLHESGFTPTHPAPPACLSDGHHIWRNETPYPIQVKLLGIPQKQPMALFTVDDKDLGPKSTVVYYPEGKELGSVAIDDGPSFRFLEGGWVRTEQQGYIVTGIDNTAARDIQQVEFSRGLHICKITITKLGISSNGPETTVINLPDGGQELRQQLDTLEASFHKYCPSVTVQEHYSNLSAGLIIGSDLVLVLAFLGLCMNKKTAEFGCIAVLIWLWVIGSVISLLTDISLHDFLSAS